MYSVFIKPIIDFLIALVLLVLLSPLLLVLILLLLVVNHGKPFFLQPRPGKNGKVFRIIKFKTMRDFKPGSSIDIHSPKRVTPIGGFVRKYSLDELLQLVNVLKGDMSLVGPRPLLVEYLPLYNEEQRKRHNVRPGITGWAQINGRNTIDWNQKFKLDVWYVENISAMLDLKIIYKTFIKVIKKSDINQNENKTMPQWAGN
ncbi:sugar transferase [Muricauda brasiliensis]|uniref:sugar transferase n=1 Tax=Muricauda brasiliensis TaxID=2162892 RepID=UPI000D3492CD|nr:sugar transferase [Muricauda brasiliensis]